MLTFQRHRMTSQMTTMFEANYQTFTKIQLNPVSRVLIVLLIVVTIIFLHTRIFQPRLMMGCRESEALKPRTRFEVWILNQQERRARIARVCRRAGGRIRRRLSRQMFSFNEEHRLLFCFQHKVN